MVDAGTGSGILALFAAEAGAKKVYAVEIDPQAISLARRSMQASPYGDRIEVVESDVTKFRTERPVDVVVMEMLDTGLITEQQAPAINALRRHKVIDSHTRLVPRGVRCYVEGVEYDFNFYGLSMPLTLQARNNGVQKRVKKVLSEPVAYQSLEFSSRITTMVEEVVELPIEESGRLNALRLRTETVLADDFTVWETSDMNMPVILPIDQLAVRKGETITVSISYFMGGGYNSLKVSVAKSVRQPRLLTPQ